MTRRSVFTSHVTHLLLFVQACAFSHPPPSPMLARYEGWEYAYCASILRERGVDIQKENAAAMARARALAGKHSLYFDAIVVPGYTPLDQTSPVPGVHAVAMERLLRAADSWEQQVAPFIIVSGGFVHPDDNPFNEALEMKRFLTAGGVPESAVFIEPCARHSHTNLRNTGRLMLATGLTRGLIVTSYDQAYYFQNAHRTGFALRCLADFGHTLGRLKSYTPQQVAFYPHEKVFAWGPDPIDP